MELAARLDSLASLEARLVEARVDAAEMDREFAALQRRIDGLKAAGPLLGEKAAEVRALEVWLAEARTRPVPEAPPPTNPPAEQAQPGQAKPGDGQPGPGGKPGGGLDPDAKPKPGEPGK